jgi:hypothetical protein
MQLKVFFSEKGGVHFSNQDLCCSAIGVFFFLCVLPFLPSLSLYRKSFVEQYLFPSFCVSMHNSIVAAQTE